MLTNQYLLSMHRQDHPNHHLLYGAPPTRRMTRSIIDHTPYVQPYLSDGEPVERNYKTRLKRIHDDAHTVCRNNYPVNKVLNTRPPPINVIDERTLNRQPRSKLAQLRSGYSPYLQTYLHRINASDSPRCPDCKLEDHTTRHLFNCTVKRTNMTPIDLWNKPIQCTKCLKLSDQ